MKSMFVELGTEEHELLLAYERLGQKQQRCFLQLMKVFAGEKAPPGFLDRLLRVFPGIKELPDYELIEKVVLNS